MAGRVYLEILWGRPVNILHRSLIFDASQVGDDIRINCFTSLVRLASGILIAGWQSGRAKQSPENHIRLAQSSDGGRSSTPLYQTFDTTYKDVPGSLASAEMVEVEPGRLLLFTTWFDRSDPDRPLFDPDTEGILRSRLLFCVSDDEGASWGKWKEIPTPGLTGCASTGPVMKWSDGRIAFAFESFKEFDDPAPARHGAWLLVSSDGGRSFESPWLVARDPEDRVYYWDQRLCCRQEKGAFSGLFWTHDRSAQSDLKVHLLHGSLDESDTGAKQQPAATAIPGQIAAPAVTDDGRLIAFVVDRGDPGTMSFWESEDDGQSWPREKKRIIHLHDEQAAVSQAYTQIDFAEYWEDMGKWSFGHPAVCALENGQWLLAYYAGTPEQMNIHGVLIEV